MSDLFPAPAEGDFVLVDTSDYGLPGDRWCRVAWVLPPGAASAYRVNAAVPGYGVGLFAAAEVAGWRACGRGEAPEGTPRFAALMAEAALTPGLPPEVSGAFESYWRRGEPR